VSGAAAASWGRARGASAERTKCTSEVWSSFSGSRSLNAVVRPSEGGAEVAVSFGRAEVVPQLVDQSPSVEILLYVFDEHGRAVGFKAKRINFSGAGRVNTGYLTLREPFELPAGKYTAKILLRISGSRSLGFARRDFVVE
jgi:hypothetical protein